jgi:hypothetical protein
MVVDCIHFVQDRAQRRAVVNTAMNILLCKRWSMYRVAERLLASRETFCSMDLTQSKPTVHSMTKKANGYLAGRDKDERIILKWNALVQVVWRRKSGHGTTGFILSVLFDKCVHFYLTCLNCSRDKGHPAFPQALLVNCLQSTPLQIPYDSLFYLLSIQDNPSFSLVSL